MTDDNKYRIGMIILFAVAIVLALLLDNATAGPRKDGKPFRASYYTGSQGACGALTGNYVATNRFPCGAKLKITYKGETVTGIVKDRMGAWPDKGCHCVDLSKRLFSKLAPTGKGVIEVRVRKA